MDSPSRRRAAVFVLPMIRIPRVIVRLSSASPHRFLVCCLVLAAVRPAVAQEAPLIRAEWQQPAVDLGRGLVYLRQFPVDGAAPDTLSLRSAPSRGGAVRAYFICEPRGEHGWAYVVASSESLAPNVVEFDYEVAGLPIDSITPDRAWARALIGTSRRGQLVTAWVTLDSASTGWLWWEEYLPRRGGVYLRQPAGAAFAASPDGAELPSPLSDRHPAEDHWLEVLARHGAWLRVRLTQPAALCGDEAPPDQISDTLWVRYLDRRGRPLVWYYTRGC